MPQKRYPHPTSLGKIGILTKSGKAYLALVSELARRRMEYVSLPPGRPIPLDVRVIITDGSGSAVQGRRIVTFKEGCDPRKAVEEALLLLQGKARFKELVLGIDPGKQTGLAVLGDGAVLETGTYSQAKDLIREVVRIFSAFPSERSIIKIGMGAEEYSNVLRVALAPSLPPSVEIQMVEEAGTTTDNLPLEDEGMSKNIASAIRIALRQGKPVERGG